MSKFISNNKFLKDRRRELRRKQTKHEAVLWSHLRGRKVANMRFVRQYSMGPYVLDFYCPLSKIAIELDGSSHDSEDAKAYDKDRDSYLEGLGVKVWRFKNEIVMRKDFVSVTLLPLLFIREVDS